MAKRIRNVVSSDGKSVVTINESGKFNPSVAEVLGSVHAADVHQIQNLVKQNDLFINELKRLTALLEENGIDPKTALKSETSKVNYGDDGEFNKKLKSLSHSAVEVFTKLSDPQKEFVYKLYKYQKGKFTDEYLTKTYKKHIVKSSKYSLLSETKINSIWSKYCTYTDILATIEYLCDKKYSKTDIFYIITQLEKIHNGDKFSYLEYEQCKDELSEIVRYSVFEL